ncbi:unnamed protein product [Amaranthus hypochondriacus]
MENLDLIELSHSIPIVKQEFGLFIESARHTEEGNDIHSQIIHLRTAAMIRNEREEDRDYIWSTGLSNMK